MIAKTEGKRGECPSHPLQLNTTIMAALNTTIMAVLNTTINVRYFYLKFLVVVLTELCLYMIDS